MPKIQRGFGFKLAWGAALLLGAGLWRGAAQGQAQQDAVAPSSAASGVAPEADVRAKVEVVKVSLSRPRLSSRAYDSNGGEAGIEVAQQLPPVSSLDGDDPMGMRVGMGSRRLPPHDTRFALVFPGLPALEPLPTPDPRGMGVGSSGPDIPAMWERRLNARFQVTKTFARPNASQPWREVPWEASEHRPQILTRSASWQGQRFLIGLVRVTGGGQWRYEGDLMVFPPFRRASSPRRMGGLGRYSLAIEVSAPLVGDAKWPPPWARTAEEIPKLSTPITRIEYSWTKSPQWRAVPRRGEPGFPLVVARRGGKWQFRAVFGQAGGRTPRDFPQWSGRYFGTQFNFYGGETISWLSNYSSTSSDENRATERITEGRSTDDVLKQNGIFELQAQGKNTFKVQLKIGPDQFGPGDYEYDEPLRMARVRAEERARREAERYEFKQPLREKGTYRSEVTFGVAQLGIAAPTRSFEATIGRLNGRVRFRGEGAKVQINGLGQADDIVLSDLAGRVEARVEAPLRPGSTTLWAEILGARGEVIKANSLQITFARAEWRVVYGKWRLSTQADARGDLFERPLWVCQEISLGRGSFQEVREVQTVPIAVRDLSAPGQKPDAKRVWLSAATLKTEANSVYQAPDEKIRPPGAMQFFRADPSAPGTRQMAAFDVEVGAVAKTPQGAPR